MSYLSFHTNDEKGLFTNNFNEDYVIEQDSKIGLVNIKFQPIEQVFDKQVNDSNEEYTHFIQFSLDDNNFYNAQINPILNTNNLQYNFILPDIGYNMNRLLDLDSSPKAIGLQWKVEDNRQPHPEKVSFKYSIFPYIYNSDLYNLNNVEINEIGNNQFITKTNGILSKNLFIDSTDRVVVGHEFTHGCGFWRVRIDKFEVPKVGEENRGFNLLLVKKDPQNYGTHINTADILLGINLPYGNHGGNSHNYRYINNGVYTTTAVAPANISNAGANNDVVELNREDGKINAVVYQAGGVSHTLFSIDLVSDLGFTNNTQETLYPVLVIGATDAEMILSNPRVHLDPFDMNIPFEVSNVQLNDQTLYGTVTPPIPNSTNGLVSKIRLNFRYVLDENINKVNLNDETNTFLLSNFGANDQTNNDIRRSLQRFLGFQDSDNFQLGVNEGNFIADNIFRPTFYSKMYYLECQNLELDTYTSIGNGKKNILLPLPIFNRFDNHFITYEPNNIYSVKLKNINKIPLRSFRFRLLDQNLESVRLLGRSDLTVVIDK